MLYSKFVMSMLISILIVALVASFAQTGSVFFLASLFLAFLLLLAVWNL